MTYEIDKEKIGEGFNEMVKVRINQLEEDLSDFVGLDAKPSVKIGKINGYIGKLLLELTDLSTQYDTAMPLTPNSHYMSELRKITLRKMGEIKDRRRK